MQRNSIDYSGREVLGNVQGGEQRPMQYNYQQPAARDNVSVISIGIFFLYFATQYNISLMIHYLKDIFNNIFCWPANFVELSTVNFRNFANKWQENI